MIAKRFQWPSASADGRCRAVALFTLIVGLAAFMPFAAAAARAEVVPVPSGAFIGIEAATEAGSLKVTETLPLCPAVAAGIERGDRLIQLNGKPLRSLPPLLSAQIQAAKPDGKPFELTVEGSAGTRTIGFVPAAADAKPEELVVEVAEGAELGASFAAEGAVLRIAKAKSGGVISRADLGKDDAILHVACQAADDPKRIETMLAQLVWGQRDRITLGVGRGRRGHELVTLVRAGAAQQVAKKEPARPIKIEAEAFTGLAGSAFVVEEATWPAVSGGKLIRLGQGRTGSIGTSLARFGVEPGVYDVAVTFIDESDGTSRGTLRIGGATREWVFDRNTGGAAIGSDNLRTVSFDGIPIDANAELVLSAALDGDEWARIDFVELARTAEPGPQVTTSFLADTNFYGRDYDSFDAAGGAEQCQQACIDDVRCQAWTHVRPGIQGPDGKCWLKDSVPAETHDDCCTSGVKQVVASDETAPGGSGSADADASDDEGPHLRVGGMAVTITRRVAANHAASDPTRTFTEHDTTVFLAFQNKSGQHLRADVDVYPDAVHGFDPGKPYWRGAGVGIGAGQRNSLRLDGPASGLIPGRYRVAVRVGGATRSATLTVKPDHPFATTVDDQFEEKLGPNIALAALGATVQASSSWNDVPSADRLIDGIDSIEDPGREGQCINCGWATRKGDRRPTVTVDLAGDRPAQISTVIVDTRQFWPRGRSWDWVTGWLPKAVAVSVSETGDPDAFTRVATASLHRDRLRQAIALPEGTLAKAVRLEVLKNVSGDAGAAFVELEVREAAEASPSIIGDAEVNLAMPALGGALVRYTGYWDKWPASRLFDGAGTSWVSYDRYFPQDFTIAFKDDRTALIDRIRLAMVERAGPDTWPSEVAISLSKSSPLDGFVEVGRFPVEKRAGTQEFPVGEKARFVKVRLLDNHGADKTTLSEIAVIEGRRDGYTSVLLRDVDTTDEDVSESREETLTDSHTVPEVEPNDTLEEANTLALDMTLEGQIDPLGELDSFALPDLGQEASALTLSYGGRPYIRHGLSLLDGGGGIISHFNPGDLPARDAHLTFQLTGDESFLQLSEPPASVVVIWDTSGSMQGSEQGLERAVREYIRRAPPSQKMNLIRFSNDVEVLLPMFTSDKSRLRSALNGKFGPNGGTRLYDAVLKGMELLDGVQGNRAILVMTDGEDNGKTWHDHFWREVEQNRIRLYTIGLGGGLENYSAKFATSGRRILRHLALGTNGNSFFAAESAALSSFYGRIADELSRPATYLLRPTVERGFGMLQLVATGEQVPSAAMPAVHLLYDMSGSMRERGPGGQPKYVLARNAIYAALDSLPEGAPFAFTVYGARIPEKAGKERACTDIVTLQEIGPLNKQAVKEFVARQEPRGGTTPLAGSIRHVAETFAREKGGIIVAVTDGIEECDPDPTATIDALKRGNLEYLELNVVGFALRDPKAREMMETIAEIGGGRYFDAADSDALARALKEAMAARYEVRDAADRVVASGTIDGTSVTVPAGFYRVDIAAAGAPIRTRDVRVDHDHVTTVRVNKVGSEVDVAIEAPRSLAETRQARRDCGSAAAQRDPGERTRRIQEKLNQLGFDVGAADNQAGPRTRRAIQAFQEHHDLPIKTEINLLLEQHLDCVIEIGEVFLAEVDATMPGG